MNHRNIPMPRVNFVPFCILVAFLSCTPTTARPFRGVRKWDILLCHPSDNSTELAPSSSYYNSMIFGAGPGSLNDAWKRLSNGGFYIEGNVLGWYEMDYNYADYVALSRGDKMARCRAAAEYSPVAGTGIVYVTYPGVDLFGGNGFAFFGYNSEVGAYQHEVGHGLGFQHSFVADTRYKNADWAAPGEYGDMFDAMSYANVFSTDSPGEPGWGNWGPGMNAYHLDRMGWVPRNKIFRFGSDKVYSRTLTLAPLTSPNNAGYMLIRIPIDKNDRFHYLTVEYRVNAANTLDAGLPGNRVLIHEIKPRYDKGNLISYNSHLIVNTSGPVNLANVLQSANIQYTSIKLMSSNANGATVQIKSTLPRRCKVGFVWREAYVGDYVCVKPAVRTQARADNAAHNKRVNFRTGRCNSPWVFRKAARNDNICVTVATHNQVLLDNKAAASRIDPGFAAVFPIAYGPNTCKQGWVWREADYSDWVCVTAEVRQQVKDDNSVAASRWVNGAFGPKTCISGYVWREAFPGDLVCVTPDRRTAAKNDNAQAEARLWQPLA